MQPLSRVKRITYMTLFTIVFLLCIPVLILYSIGYRLDDALALVKTGGIYVQSDITDANVYIDGELKKETGLFLRNSFIQNLRPDEYEISVEKEGYRMWKKRVTVYENKVTELHLFTLPVDLVSTNVPRYLAATTTTATRRPNPEYVELQDLFAIATSTATSTRATTPVISTSTASTSRPQLDPRTLKPDFKEFGDLYSWIEDGDVQLEWVGSAERIPFYFCENGICQQRITVSVEDDIVDYEWYQGRNDAMVISTVVGVDAIEVDNRTAPNSFELYRGENQGIRIASNGDVVVKLADSFMVIQD